jgi:hypothetical protein
MSEKQFECPFCDKPIAECDEFWPEYLDSYRNNTRRVYVLKAGVYHQQCWQPAQVAERLLK